MIAGTAMANDRVIMRNCTDTITGALDILTRVILLWDLGASLIL
jgi:hypothetical protein